MRTYILILLGGLLLASCNIVPVAFTEPQPSFKPPITKFKKKWQGKYLNQESPDDGFIITDKSLVLIDSVEEKTSISDLKNDRSFPKKLLSNAEIIEWYAENNKKAIIQNDSVFIGYWDYYDTVYCQDFRYYKGKYYFNLYYEDYKHWEVYELTLNQNTIGIGRLEENDELFNLNYGKEENTLNENGEVTGTYLSLNPNKKEFKALVKSGAFKVDEEKIHYKVKE